MKIAVLGYGTIGSGVVEVLEKNKEVIAKRAGRPLEVKHILDLREFPGDPYEAKVVHDYEIIRRDAEVEIVVEAMGGVEPAFTFAKGALEAGKHFVTSNKALMAKHGAALLAMAQEKGLACLFAASVGGGSHIIRPMNDCLTADVIEEISGILNGTTNYMMTKMYEEGAEFADVLKDAQQKGFAEADPTADIEGHDACRKIAILTSLACAQQVDFEDIPTEGITKITAEDIKYAKAMGRKIRLLGSSYKTADSYCALVAPYLLDDTSPLCGVNGVFNAIFVKGNMLGDAMFYGSGAGKLPTASAVVADIVDIAKRGAAQDVFVWKPEKLTLADARQLQCKYFVRTADAPAAVEAAFGAVTYIQAEGVTGECAFVTETMDGFAYEAAAEKLSNIKQCIRVK